MAVPVSFISPEDASRIKDLCGRLNERERREFAGTLSLTIGRGGQTYTSNLLGLSPKTIRRGEMEMRSEREYPDRIRLPGGGAKKSEVRIPTLADDIMSIVQEYSYGSPMEEIYHITLSLREIEDKLNEMYRIQAETLGTTPQTVSDTAIGRILKTTLHCSLQQNRKLLQVGKEHPHRDEQFNRLNELRDGFLAAGLPVISLDTKKKEITDLLNNPGAVWRLIGDPVQVLDHDFRRDGTNLVIPHGIYCLNDNTGFVSLGVDHDTAEFARQNMEHWWTEQGRVKFPKADEILVLCDCGGSNGYRSHIWYSELQKFADFTGLKVTVAHYPPGTSKHNPIEHRLWPQITRCWRGQPLTSIVKMHALISATTTRTGLTVSCWVNPCAYETGRKVSEEEMDSLTMTRAAEIGDLNYSFTPRTASQA